MRKNKLIALIGTLTMAAAGLAAVSAGVSRSAKPMETEAATSSEAGARVWIYDQNTVGAVIQIWNVSYATGYGESDLLKWFTNTYSHEGVANNFTVTKETYGNITIKNSSFISGTHYDKNGQHRVYQFPHYVNSFSLNIGDWKRDHTTGDLSVPDKKGYFWGFYCNSGGTGTFDSTSHDNSFGYTTRTITKKFSLAGTSGTTIGTDKYYDLSYYKLPTNPTAPAGYTFSKWTSDLAGNTQITDKNKTFTADSTIYAYCTPNQYTVTLNPNGGEGGASTVDATYGSKMGNVAYPKRIGYEFAGYYDATSGGTQYFDEEGICIKAWDKTDASPILYAHWTPSTNTPFKVNYYTQKTSLDGYEFANSETFYGTTGTTTSYTPTGKTGFTAVQPYETATIKADGTTEVSVNFNRNAYTMTYNYGEAQGQIPSAKVSDNVYYGCKPNQCGISELPYYEWNGKRICGWKYSGMDITADTPYGIADDITVTAQWENIPVSSCNVSFVYNSGEESYGTITTSTGTNPISVAAGSSISVSNNVMTIDGKTITATASTDTVQYHYEFKGFSPNSGTIDEDTTITVDFSRDVIQYDLNWSFGGGTPVGDYTSAGKHNYGTTVTAPSDVTKTGYTFTGWDKTIVSPLVDNATYTAQFSAKTYTVALDRGEATSGATSVTATYDATLPNIVAPSLSGYSFVGYFTQQGGQGEQYYNESGVSSHVWTTDSNDVTLYAYYTVNQYIVTFNGNGGSTPSPATKQVTYNSTYGELPTSSRLGYVFDGWYDAQTGGNKIEATTTVTITAPQTLYAHWNVPQYFVQLGDGEKIPVQTMTSDTATGMIYQVSNASNLNLYGGTSIKFYLGDELISSNITKGADIGDSKNNVNGDSSSNWTIHNDASSKIYLKAFDNNGSISYQFWINGYSDVIDPSWLGFESGSVFYLKDFDNGWRQENPTIKVGFFSPVGKTASSSGEITMTAVEGKEGLYKCTVPQMTDMFGNPVNVSWHDVYAKRYDTAGTTEWNFTSSMGKTVGYHNGIQLTSWGGDGQPTNANLFMYADAGVSSGDGLYIDPSKTGMVQWDMSNSNLYVRFFSPLGDGVDSTAEGWSEIATLIPGEEHLYQAEVPTLNGSNVQWSGLQVIRCNKGSGRYVPSDNLDISVDIIYSSGILNNRHITLSGEADGQLKQKVTCDNNYIDAQRAEAYGTNFLNTCATCDPDGKTQNITSTQWNSCKDEYNAMPSAARSLFTNATALEDSDKKVEAAAARYDYIVGKYGVSTYVDYASRNPSNLGGSRKLLSVNDVSTSTWIIASVAIVGIAAVGVFFIYRKRKEN